MALQPEDVAAPRPELPVTGSGNAAEPTRRGDGWSAVGSLLLLVGGMLVVSYLIF